MSEQYWTEWARTLQRSRLRGFVLTFLESSGPLKILLAQAMLSSTPFINASGKEKWQAAAEMLEDKSESRKFSALLREENTH
jgi:hypothetical protein